MAQWIIIGLIAVYAGIVIYKKVSDLRKGKFCSCGCKDCPSASKCHK